MIKEVLDFHFLRNVSLFAEFKNKKLKIYSGFSFNFSLFDNSICSLHFQNKYNEKLSYLIYLCFTTNLNITKKKSI